MKHLKILILAGIVAMAGSVQANAALISFTGDLLNPGATLPDNFDPNGSNVLAAGGINLDTNSSVAVYGNGGLNVTGNVILKFTYLGYEAGFQNMFKYNGEVLFTTRDGYMGTGTDLNSPAAVREFAYNGSGLLNFGFWSGEVFGDGAPTTNGGEGVTNINGSYATNNYSIGFAGVTDNSAVLLFGDGNNTNRDNDFDDMAVLVEVSVVPLPPSAILFGTALLGLAALRRRKKPAA